MAKVRTLLHVDLDLHLDFVQTRAPYVSLKRLNLLIPLAAFKVQIFHLPLQIDHQVGFTFESTSDAATTCRELGLRQAEVGLLLQDQVVDHIVLTLHLNLHHLDASSQSNILRRQVVGCHSLLHHIVV